MENELKKEQEQVGLDLGEFENARAELDLNGITQDDVSEVSEMVFYFENHEGLLMCCGGWLSPQNSISRRSKSPISRVNISNTSTT